MMFVYSPKLALIVLLAVIIYIIVRVMTFKVNEQYKQESIILAAQDNLDFIAAEKSAVNRQLLQAENRLKAGLATITDVYEAQAQLDSTSANEISAQYQYTNKLELLRELT